MGIGIVAECRINANIGNSAVISGIQCELEKLQTAIHCEAEHSPKLARQNIASGHVQKCSFLLSVRT